jgi:3-oxoadipate enol-lactonase
MSRTGVVPASGTVRLDDIDVFVRRAGSGTPLILVSGMAETHAVWAPQQEAIRGVETFAYDLRGHGETSLGRADGTLRQLGLDLVHLLEAVGPAILVGFSLGGTIALWVAAHRADLTLGVCAIATSSKVGRSAAEYYRSRASFDGDRDELAELFREDGRSFLSDPAGDVERVVRLRLAAVGDATGYRNAARAMLRMHEEPLTPDLGRITAPTLLVHGEHDALCPDKAVRIMADEIPHARVLRLPDVGHLMHLEEPDALTELIQDFANEANRP